MTHPKVKRSHLNRKAVIYIRQSSLHQVIEHDESKRRQYQLVALAESLGWAKTACEIIDDDQAISASQSYNRPGYQRLTAMVALREVGLIVGQDVGRLARNCLDWYELLQIAAVFDVLVADEEGVYDLNQFNDRLLLGLKGIFAEAELHQIQARMVGARMSKAQRGELRFRLPIGLEWDDLSHKPRLSSDQAIYEALALVFRLFKQLRSIRAVLHYLHQEGIELPYQLRQKGMGCQVQWRPATADALRAILSNPLYAGVYCYSRRQVQLDPIRRVVHRRMRPRSEWVAFLPENHPGYLTLAEFEENQRLIADNAYRFPNSKGAARKGHALIQGLALCAYCGRKMHVRYSQGRAAYLCDFAHLRYGDPVCNRASTRHVDGLITHLFLQLINTNALEVAWSFQDKLQQEAHHLEVVWQQKVSRLEYEANLARRRYEAVDPDNRLVAQTLETEWNQKLSTLVQAQQNYEARRPTNSQLVSTLAEMRHVLGNLHDYWFADAITVQDKKELLRCLVEHVLIEGRDEMIQVQLHWYGGSVSQLAVPKRLQTSADIYFRIQELACSQTDQAIADQLNAVGSQTACRRSWTARHVLTFRHFHQIPSAFDANPASRLLDTAYITGAEASQRLGVERDSIHQWCQLGILASHQDGFQQRFWVHWDEDVAYRLSGDATPVANMVSVRSLCQTQGTSRQEVFAWALEHHLPIYRLRRGSQKPFYILLPDSLDPQL
ncbi:MAG: recombinase family protein [Chloroflexi bacterium]|nr:recombinase family protein [Chloroflexota bacterium]